jgi:hypothetical protein
VEKDAAERKKLAESYSNWSKTYRSLLWSLEDVVSSDSSEYICFSRDLESKTIALCNPTLPNSWMPFNLLKA